MTQVRLRLHDQTPQRRRLSRRRLLIGLLTSILGAATLFFLWWLSTDGWSMAHLGDNGQVVLLVSFFVQFVLGSLTLLMGLITLITNFRGHGFPFRQELQLTWSAAILPLLAPAFCTLMMIFNIVVNVYNFATPIYF